MSGDETINTLTSNYYQSVARLSQHLTIMDTIERNVLHIPRMRLKEILRFVIFLFQSETNLYGPQFLNTISTPQLFLIIFLLHIFLCLIIMHYPNVVSFVWYTINSCPVGQLSCCIQHFVNVCCNFPSLNYPLFPSTTKTCPHSSMMSFTCRPNIINRSNMILVGYRNLMVRANMYICEVVTISPSH